MPRSQAWSGRCSRSGNNLDAEDALPPTVRVNFAVLFLSIFRVLNQLPGLRRWAYPALPLVALMGLVGCETASSESGMEPVSVASGGSTVPASSDSLRIGVAANMPPFVFKEGGQLVGLEVDLGKELAKDLGKTPQFFDLAFEDLIPALQQGRVDIVMAGLNYTPERAAIISMTTPYLRSGQMALVLRKNVTKFGLPGLIGNTTATVGAEKGTTGEFLVESSFPNAKLKTYRSAQAGAEAVANGEIEILIHDAPTIYWLAGTYQNIGVSPARPVLTEDLMVWGIARGNSALLDEVNAIITKWAQDGKLSQIASRWISF